MAPTLATLVDDRLRSQLVLGLEAYLQAFVDLSAWSSMGDPFLFLPGGISQQVAAVELYQLPDVVNLRDLADEVNRLRKELDERGEFGRGPFMPPTAPWEAEREVPGCSVILGRPGEGKTLLTRLTCRWVADKSLKLLRNRTCQSVDIEIPIWLRFEVVLRAVENLRALRETATRESRHVDELLTLYGALQQAVNETVPDMVTSALGRVHDGREDAPSPTFAAAYIRRALGRTSTWLFIDALDEPGDASNEVDRLGALAALRNLACTHVVVTCRKHEYKRTLTLPQQLSTDLREYDLEPLKRTQQTAFVSRWFGEHSPKGADVLALIDADPQFQDMAGNALMLTLICATRERHPIGPGTRRVQLYDLMLRDIVSRARHKPIHDSAQIPRRLRVLQEIVWPSFELDPANPSVRERDWTPRLNAFSSPELVNGPDLEADCRREGLIHFHDDAFWFLHRSFFEFIAAARMARKGAAEIRSMVALHAGDEAWRGALTMAIGHLGLIPEPSGHGPRAHKAGDVVEEIVATRPGPPGVAVALMGDAVVDAGSACVLVTTLERLRMALLGVMRNSDVLPKVRTQAGAALGRLGDPRFHGEELWCLPKFQPDSGKDGQLQPEPLLGFVEIDEGEFWMGSN